MKWMILIVTSFYTLNPLLAQQRTLPEIIDLSKKYYSSKTQGKIFVRTNFKASIAESFNTDTSIISYCKNESFYNISTSDFHFLLNENFYYIIDIAKKAHIDLSREKSFRKEKMSYLQRFPHFNKFLLTNLLNNDFKVVLDTDLIHVYNSIDHYYFDTTNFAIVSYKGLIFDKTGLQITEWEVLKETPLPSCDSLALKNYISETKKISPSQTVRNNPKLVGKNINDFVSSENLFLDNGLLLNFYTQGKSILLDFFYQSCMPCIQSFGHLKEMYSTFETNNIALIGVDPLVNDSSTMKKFKNRYKLTHPVLSGQDANQVNSRLNPKGVFPFYILINKDGIIQDVIEGYDPKKMEKLKNQLTKL